MLGVSFYISAFTSLLVAVYPAFSYNLDIIITETLFTSCLTTAIYMLIKFMLHIEKGQKAILQFVFANVSFMCATMIRAQALPFIVIEIFFVIIYFSNCSLKERLKFIAIILGITLIFLIPLWIRNWNTFQEFWLLTQSGDGPKVWGAQPYFLDMSSTANMESSALSIANRAIDAQTYLKWRIFGFFNFMWYDFWDENLAHPNELLSMFNFIHLFIIVPTVALIPIIIRKAKKEILLIAAVPILFTLMCLPFHGLARYVFPSIPCVFVLLSVMLEWLYQKVKNGSGKVFTANGTQFEPVWFGKIDRIFRYGYITFSIVFSVILIYSVYIFAWDIKTEMSEYRLQRAYDISVSDVKDFDVIQSVQLIDQSEFWNIANVKQLSDNSFQGVWDSPPIMNVTVPEIENYDGNKNIVTKVELNVSGGHLFDSSTIYWAGDKTEVMSEDEVYGRFPRNAFQDTQTIYIDDNVSSLMIVPSVIRGSKFSIDGIEIKKYIVPD